MATLGRLNDFIESGIITLNHCNILTFDCIDQMIEMDYEPILRRFIVKNCNKRQTLIFASTMGWEIIKFAADALKDFRGMSSLTLYVHVQR